jgi:hypothetical protein
VSDATTQDQARSHADGHDLDKLARWKSDLSTTPVSQAGEFPIYAAFLVSGEDRDSHNVFRQYRSAFEEMSAGFHHLVIFGQHGTSSTLLSFLSELELVWESVPVLALIASPTSTEALTIALPKGTSDAGLNSSDPWNQALDGIGEAARGGSVLDLGSIGGLEGASHRTFSSGTMVSAVERVLESLSAVN